MSTSTAIPSPTRIFHSIIRPLPLPLAQSRLKLNLFAIALLTFFRSVFTPYRQFRRGVIWFVDDYVQGGSGRNGGVAGKGVWWIETILTIITLWNILEAYLSVRSPIKLRPAAPTGLQLTPSRISSPLIRPYPSSPSSQSQTQTPTRPTQSTQIQPHHSSPLARRSNTSQTPNRPSPLSASTARALDIPFRPRESTGLFYPEDAGASPSKVGRKDKGQESRGAPGGGNGGGGGGGGGGGQGSGDEFVMVEREEKEWVDNVWKGVRGKGGKVAI